MIDPGTALAIVSLTFQAFAGCIQAFVLLTEAAKIGKLGANLLCQLELQEVQLVEWARQVGLLEEPPHIEPRLNLEVIRKAVVQLDGFLSDTERLCIRYNFKVQIAAESQPKAPAAIQDRASRLLQLAELDSTRQKILARAAKIKKSTNVAKRLWWAAVDKDKFKEFLSDIRLYIHDLWRLLDPVRQQDTLRNTQMLLSKVISLDNRLDELNALQSVILQSVVGDATSNQRFAPLPSVIDMKTLRLALETRATQSQLDSALPRDTPRQRKDVLKGVCRLDYDKIVDFSALPRSPEMGFAKYPGHTGAPVFAEVKEVPPTFRSKVLERVEDLVALLGASKDQSFRHLSCIGYAYDSDTEKVMFLFNPPAHAAIDRTISLRDLFSSRPELRLYPSPESRLMLAKVLARAIRNLHIAGWLHKNLRSENVLFFLHNETVDETLLADPFIVGYAFARADTPAAWSDQASADVQRDIYRHPAAIEVISTSYSASMDLYSLGTVLVEIGDWRALAQIVSEVIQTKPLGLPIVIKDKVQSHLLKCDPRSNAGLTKMRFRMGEVYAQVVKTLLRGQASVVDDQGNASLAESIVQMLEKAYSLPE